MEGKMRKGDLVRVNETRCFTQQSGGTRPYPIESWYQDEQRFIPGAYIATAEDNRKWRDEKRKATEGKWFRTKKRHRKYCPKIRFTTKFINSYSSYWKEEK